MKTKKNKPFEVLIELDVVEFRIMAKNKTEARKKALSRLSKKNPISFIQTGWSDHKKRISVEEL